MSSFVWTDTTENAFFLQISNVIVYAVASQASSSSQLIYQDGWVRHYCRYYFCVVFCVVALGFWLFLGKDGLAVGRFFASFSDSAAQGGSDSIFATLCHTHRRDAPNQ